MSMSDEAEQMAWYLAGLLAGIAEKYHSELPGDSKVAPYIVYPFALRDEDTPGFVVQFERSGLRYRILVEKEG